MHLRTWVVGARLHHRPLHSWPLRPPRALHGPEHVHVRPGIHGHRLQDTPLRPNVRARGAVRRAGHVRVQAGVVRRELHDAGLHANVREWGQLHGAGHVRVPHNVEGR